MPRQTSSELKALLFFAGFEIGYQVNGSGCSSPQTTELRVAGEEGGGAAERTLMKWVHKSSFISIAVTGVMSLLAGNMWALFGAAVSVLDMESSYWYAKRSGHKLKDSSGTTMDDGVPVRGGTPLRVRS